MFITVSNIQNGEYVPQDPVIDNREGNLEIALSEMLYYPKWANISEELENNVFKYEKLITIPDGYYDICTLDEEIFTPLGLRLRFNPATGLVTVAGIVKSFRPYGLAPTLGLPDVSVEAGALEGEQFHKLGLYKELFVHLDEGLSTTENRHNKLPSTLLRSIHVKTEGCFQGRAETFASPQFKRLENGTLSGIKISVRDQHHNLVKLAYFSCVLNIRQIVR